VRRDEPDLLAAAVVIGCCYEVLALTTRRVPTITRLVRVTASHRHGRFAAWLWCGFVAWHFLEPLDP